MLSDLSDVRFIPELRDVRHTFWMTVIFVKDAERLSEYLLKNGVQTRRIFYPLHWQPSYKFLEDKSKYPNAEKGYKEGLALPSYVLLESDKIEKIVTLIKKYFK